MSMAMMQVRIMDVLVGQSAMPVRMAMRLRTNGKRMIMLMVFIMNMGMVMFHRLVVVYMQVSLGEVQPEANGH